MAGSEEIGEKKKVQVVAQSYYARKEVQEAIYKFCINRETVPRYLEGFGKRPDVLDYPSDVMTLVKKGATSFHCSEEIWSDPLKISTDMTPDQYNTIKIGWDFLIDIDSKFFDYAKIAAKVLIQALESHGIKNVGIKYSVTGETPLLIEMDGEMRLLEIKEVTKYFKNGKKIKVLSLDKNKKIILSDIYNYLEHKDKIYNIFHSQSKIPVKATKYHSVFIWDEGKIIEKKVEDLKKGNFLITFNSKENPFSTKKHALVNNFSFAKNQFVKKDISRKLKVDGNLMRLIGYFLAEGHVTDTIHQVGFSFNRNEIEYVRDCTNLLEKITKKKTSTRHPNVNSTQILIHSKEWAHFFSNFCGTKKEKHIPNFAWKVEKKDFIELLRGYIRGDGHKLGEYTITIKSVSKRLIRELVWLCKLNGISCSLSSEQNKPHTSPQGNYFKGSFVYILKLPKSELFKEFFRGRNKFSPFPNDRIFPIDGLKKVYRLIKPKKFNQYRAEQMTLSKKCANLNRIRKVLDWFYSCGSVSLSIGSREILKNYESLFGSDCAVVEIKKIEEGKIEDVYDISVEESESFFGNEYPILLHNSGSKGFHILIPSKSFPEKLYGEKTKDKFPEWPRAIAGYLKEITKEKIDQQIVNLTNKEELKKKGELIEKVYCLDCEKNLKCEQEVILKEEDLFECTNSKCKYKLYFKKGKRKVHRCPSCNFDMNFTGTINRYFCDKCGKYKSKDQLKKEQTIKSQADSVDIVLVSPRHLFRSPYSLHEKTALVSMVLTREEFENFEITMADPLKIKIRDYNPNCEAGEARELLIESLDWAKKKEPERKKYDGKALDLKGLVITEDMFPPVIKKIMNGMKEDGRKRALGVLLSFFSSLEFPKEYMEEKAYEWNKKNYKPLKEGYIQSQIEWSAKNKRLPPNYDKSTYKELGVNSETEDLKNPINYTIREAMRASFRMKGDKDNSEKETSSSSDKQKASKK